MPNPTYQLGNEGMAPAQRTVLQRLKLTARRTAAFIIDVIVACGLLLLVLWAVGEMTQGRYRLTNVPGFFITNCAPDTSESALLSELKDRALRAPPPIKTYARTQRCVAWLDFIFRNPFIRVEFQPSDRAGLLTYSTLVDFKGNESGIVSLNQYASYFPIVFLVFFLTTAWLDSVGARLLDIRVRTLDGAKLGYGRFAIRYAIIGVVFAPLFLMPVGMPSFGLIIILGGILLFPWFKGNLQQRRGLQDVLSRSAVVSVTARS